MKCVRHSPPKGQKLTEHFADFPAVPGTATPPLRRWSVARAYIPLYEIPTHVETHDRVPVLSLVSLIRKRKTGLLPDKTIGMGTRKTVRSALTFNQKTCENTRMEPVPCRFQSFKSRYCRLYLADDTKYNDHQHLIRDNTPTYHVSQVIFMTPHNNNSPLLYTSRPLPKDDTHGFTLSSERVQIPDGEHHARHKSLYLMILFGSRRNRSHERGNMEQAPTVSPTI